MAGSAPASHVRGMQTPDDVLSFWIGEPATDMPSLVNKFRRWYAGGEQLDAEIRTRFGTLIIAALAGELAHWRASLRGKLALVIVLDQFTRNVFRETPRAYAGDVAARELSLSILDSGVDRQLSLEEQLFVVMPLAHAENLELQGRSVALADRMRDASPAQLREAWAIGAQRTRHYQATIARFGRFPHRNAILGRDSTPEELEFLEAEAKKPGPLG